MLMCISLWLFIKYMYDTVMFLHAQMKCIWKMDNFSKTYANKFQLNWTELNG